MSISATFDNLIKRYGHSMTLTRPLTGDVSNVIAMRRNFSPQELVSKEFQQGDIKVRLSEKDLVRDAYPTPPLKGDRLDDGPKTFTVKAVKPLTVANETAGYELDIRG